MRLPRIPFAPRKRGGVVLKPVKPSYRPRPGELEWLLDRCSIRGRAAGVVSSFSLLSIRIVSSSIMEHAAAILRCLMIDRGMLIAIARRVDDVVDAPSCECLDIGLRGEDTMSCQRRLLYIPWGGVVCRVELYREE